MIATSRQEFGYYFTVWAIFHDFFSRSAFFPASILLYFALLLRLVKENFMLQGAFTKTMGVFLSVSCWERGAQLFILNSSWFILNYVSLLVFMIPFILIFFINIKRTDPLVQFWGDDHTSLPCSPSISPLFRLSQDLQEQNLNPLYIHRINLTLIIFNRQKKKKRIRGLYDYSSTGV